ncbi:MAG: glycosyltransferase [Ferruginibacter sp.]
MLQLLFTICIFLLAIYALLLLYYQQAWIKAPVFEPPPLSYFPFLTVIIPARNEAVNLPALLSSLMQQTYPKEFFEIIVVDDHSEDDTAAIAGSFTGVKVIPLKQAVGSLPINSYKKKALATGIRKSNGELIITTDADCVAKPNWLQTIAAFYKSTGADFIVMPVSIQYSNRFIEIFQALDFMTLQGITGASVYKKFHSMCNGANLAYSKTAFNAVNGFEGIDSIASGDDMLLMHKIFKRNPKTVHYLKSQDVIMQTAPVKTTRQFLNQRIRWASKAGKYDDKRIFMVLLMVYLLNVLLLVIPAWAFVLGKWPVLFNWALLLILKTVVEIIFLLPVALFFKEISLMKWFPLAQPFHIVYTVLAGFLGKFGRYEWKQRLVR